MHTSYIKCKEMYDNDFVSVFKSKNVVFVIYFTCLSFTIVMAIVVVKSCKSLALL